ncbi:unnamed protein product [Sphagnum jensenii]|uniref:Uncharacterized protein n=1 Tax=Sphagnum jensenii TaxID=128206 RepID=A0ABP1AT74_9BRYO
MSRREMDPCRLEDDHFTSGVSCVVGPTREEETVLLLLLLLFSVALLLLCCTVASGPSAHTATDYDEVAATVASPTLWFPQTTHHAYVLAIPSLVSLLATEVARGSAVL